MIKRKLFAALAGLLWAGASSVGRANPTELGGEPTDSDTSSQFEIEGYLRVRTGALYNFDLDRGLTPSGTPLFPVPPSGGQTLTHADLRLSTDFAFYSPTKYMAVRARIDVLDNLSMGSSPEGPAYSSLSQDAPDRAFLVRRAFGEARTAIGLIAAGRIGSHWGMGLFTNGGDCADCNFGDSADSIQFVTSIGGHVWTVAYDLSATGPEGTRADGRFIDLDREDDARTLRFSVLRGWSSNARERRLEGDATTVEYGAYFAHRTQSKDTLMTPGGGVVQIDRGLSANVMDGWFRVLGPMLHVEAEAVYVHANIDQISSIPGVLLPEPITSNQLGAAFRSEFGGHNAILNAGVDAGYASGDPAPGFGAFPRTLALGQPGDLEGLQADGISDAKGDNFRFHPDFRIDEILFHSIIGTVTDAAYLRPHLRLRSRGLGAGLFTAELAAIGSAAREASSTPGGKTPLGFELNPTLTYEANDGVTFALRYAVLFPLEGLNNATAGMAAKTAQAVRLHLAYGF